MNTLLQIIWDVDPSLFKIGPLEIRYYGLLFATGLALSYYIVTNIFKKEGIPVKQLDKLATYTILGAILGARLGHVLFYDLAYYLENPAEILFIWHGGLASHGGALGILIALLIYTKGNIKEYLKNLDWVAIPTALTGSLIRLGNLFNSEIYGVETDLPWGFVFKRNFETTAKHPTQIYESVAYILIFIFLYFFYNKNRTKLKEGYILGLFLVLVFGFRFFIEFIKNNQKAFEESLALNMGQILSIPMVVIGLFLIFRARKLK